MAQPSKRDESLHHCLPLQPMADRNFQKGFNKIYDWNLGFALRRIYRNHHHLFEAAAAKGEKRERCRGAGGQERGWDGMGVHWDVVLAPAV